MKRRRIRIRDRAYNDLAERSEFLRLQNPASALKYLDAAESCIERLARAPLLGARFAPDHAVLGELRFLPLDRFRNDLVFYRPCDGGIEVVRILNGSRDIERILSEEFGLKAETDEDESETDVTE
jgi:toxin ParE1/3/4